MAQVAPTFLHEIPSICQRNPGLPAVLRDINLNNRIDGGDLLDYARVTDSKRIAQALEAIRDLGVLAGEPQITPQIVQSAYARALAVETSYASIVYSPANIIEQIQQVNQRLQQMEVQNDAINQQIRTIDERSMISIAKNYNLRIVSRNTRMQTPHPLAPLQKTVPGSGRDKAYAILPENQAATRLAFIHRFPLNAIPAGIGSTPRQFNPKIEGHIYNHIEILGMVVFYNETFGIEQADNITDRIIKFRSALLEF